MKRLAAALILLASPGLAADPLPIEATGTYQLDKNHANVVWEVSHLGFSNYVGRFNSLDATLHLDAKDPTKSQLTAKVDSASVDTNNTKLQDELKATEAFNVAQFPEIMFVSKSIELTGPETGKVTGDLTFLGVTKPVTLETTLVGHGKHPMAPLDVVGFSATGVLKRSEWGFKQWLPMVGDEVKFTIDAEFDKSTPVPGDKAEKKS